MYLDASCPIPWRWRMPLERAALALPVREEPCQRLGATNASAMLTIAAAGDLSMEKMPSYHPADILNDVLPFWESADLRVANLESQCTSRTQPAVLAKGMRAPAEAAAFVAAARIDAVTVANNHALDFGSAALEESTARVRDLGVGVTGLIAAGECCARAFTTERNGLRIGMLAWCDHYRPPESGPIGARPATLPETRAMLEAVRKLRAETDVVLVQLHWGYEFTLHPLLRHRDLARQVASAGAQVVLCHHAHVPMAVELYGDSLIAHGLGNWIFADRPYFRNSHDWTFQSFLLKVGVGKERIQWAELEPFTLGPDSRIHRMTGSARAKFLSQVTRLNGRLGDEEWLGHAETARLLFETVGAATYLDKAAPAQVREKARGFTLPSGAALVGALREMEWPSARRLGAWVQSMAEVSDAPDELAAAWSAGRNTARNDAADLAKRQRWTDAFRSRIP